MGKTYKEQKSWEKIKEDVVDRRKNKERKFKPDTRERAEMRRSID